MLTNLTRKLFITGILVTVLFLGIVSASMGQSSPKFRVIAFYSASFDIAHISFANEANAWFANLAEQYNFQYESTKNWNNLNASFLSNYQVVIFLDDQPGTASQRQAFQQYMQNGGGFIGFHVCAFNTNPSSWDWYHNQFLATGAFRTNTWGPTSAVLRVEDNTHPATVGLPSKFTSAVSEWYGWTKDLRTNPDIRILCSVDPSSFPLGTDPNQSWYSGYFPIVWTNKNYKMLYANFGHNDIDYGNNNSTKSFTFSNPTQNKIVINGLLHIGGGSATVYEIPGTVQAEGYDVMSGVRKETTTDVGGGQNIGYIEAGDWLDYKVNVKTSGTYTLQYRVASQNGGGSLQLRSGSNILSTTTINPTGGWQSWTTVTTQVNLTAGMQSLRLHAATGGFNINWVRFITDDINQSPTVTITSPSANQNFTAPASVTITANASDADGSITKVEFYNGISLIGTSTASPYTFTWNNVSAGSYSLTAKATDNKNASTTSGLVNIAVKNPVIQSPYGGIPALIPGKIEAENYDTGGQNIAYNDATPGNTGATFRTEDVDIQTTGDIGIGYNIGWTAAGEWTEYTVNVSKTASYKMELRLAAITTGRTLRVEIDGIDVTGTVTSPNTTAWTTYQTVTINNISLTEGQKVLRVFHITGQLNLNYINVVEQTTINNPPSISITAPANGSTFTAPANLTITANASDDAGVAKVEFYNGTTKIGEDVTNPYSLSWTNITSGSYTINAKATDYLGLWINASPVTINVTTPVNQSPNAAITLPVNGTSFSAPALITINATASDADGVVTKVEFYNGTSLLGQDATFPYSFTWSNVASGSYSITVRATDNLGATKTSSAVTITVVNAGGCNGIPTYVENSGYTAGSIVQNAGSRYKCKPYPYSGWCNGSAWAYAPGTGSYWTDAWERLGSCTAKVSANTHENASAITISPNPATHSVAIRFTVTEFPSAEYVIINSVGEEIVRGHLTTNLESVIDLSAMNTGIYTIKVNVGDNVWTSKIVKE